MDYGFEFTFDIDTFNAVGSFSDTAWVDNDRLTFHEVFDLRMAQERGTIYPYSGGPPPPPYSPLGLEAGLVVVWLDHGRGLRPGEPLLSGQGQRQSQRQRQRQDQRAASRSIVPTAAQSHRPLLFTSKPVQCRGPVYRAKIRSLPWVEHIPGPKATRRNHAPL